MAIVGTESVRAARPPLWLSMRARGYRAGDILRAFGADTPPIQIGVITRKMGVELQFVHELPCDASLESSETSALIRVNRDHPVVRQRFSVAHELGHLMLHPLGQSFRDTAGQMGATPEEREANRFAADLLMPASMLKPLVAQFRTDMKGLARVFQVSEEAMSLRVRRLYRL